MRPSYGPPHTPHRIEGVTKTAPLLRNAALRRTSLQIGNYIGRAAPVARPAELLRCYFSVVDLHALTVAQDPAELREKTRRTAAQYIAAGIEPSLVDPVCAVPCARARAELAWILSTITGFGEAGRMTQFKDKSTRYGAECHQASACSRIRSSWPPTSCSTRPMWCRWATTRSSTSSSPVISPNASTPASARHSRCPMPVIQKETAAHLRPAEPDRQDVEVGGERRGSPVDARRPGEVGEEDHARG